jgi:ATP/ADP translocase
MSRFRLLANLVLLFTFSVDLVESSSKGHSHRRYIQKLETTGTHNRLCPQSSALLDIMSLHNRKQVAQAAMETRGGETVDTSDDETKREAISILYKVRNTIFPIYGSEVTKFLLIGSIKFFVILALTLTRDTKDTLVVTQCGAEAIAFLKVRKCVWMLCARFKK